MAGWTPLLETLFASLLLSSKHHCPGFSPTNVPEPGERPLHPELILPTSGTPERCLVTMGSFCSQRNVSPEGDSGHMRSSPTLKGAENNLDSNIWAAVKCLRLSDWVFNYLSPRLITLNTVMKR